MTREHGTFTVAACIAVLGRRNCEERRDAASHVPKDPRGRSCAPGESVIHALLSYARHRQFSRARGIAARGMRELDCIVRAFAVRRSRAREHAVGQSRDARVERGYDANAAPACGMFRGGISRSHVVAR